MRALGWGNLALGLAAPLSIAFNILAALDVFSVEWAGRSIVLSTLLGAFIGWMTWRSGRRILDRHPEAFSATCIAGGGSLGYTIVGILVMATAGRDRALEILIRHGSENWWDWSLSHFQNSSLREIPILTWWVYGIGTVIRFRLPGSATCVRERFVAAVGLSFFCALMGAIARFAQLAQDTLLSSQR
ncbi:MAG: hypothetical protein HY293_07740 [Planctomycetes bacterium]|nr:hypothetical protein [Planctomycetota bacterium]